MTLKKNIIASYASQIYITFIGIIILPLYIRYMGAEAYGLVGFFAMLQVWFNLLDFGLTPTIGRETARFRAGVWNALDFRRLFRALNSVFILIAFIGGGGLFLLSGFIAEDWLKTQDLSFAEVQLALQIMAFSVALRWMCGLYRGVINGSEMLVWLGGFNAIIATLRFVVILPVMWNFGATPTVFFIYQLLVAILQISVLFFKTRTLLPILSDEHRIDWSFTPVKPLLKFALTIAFTSSVWVLVTQTDKFVLSGILPLEEYGYFSIAVLVASGVMMINGPISTAIMPRMAKMDAEGDHAGLIHIYRQSTQLVAIIAAAICITLTFYAEPLLWIWTNDKTLTHYAVPILVLYTIGNGILAVSAFPYYLQYAKGDLRLHLIGNVGFIMLLIPAIIWSAIKYGGIGAGYAWLVMNVIYFIAWVPVIHNKFEPGLNLLWFGRDVVVIIMVATIVGYGLFSTLPQIESRFWLVITVIGFGVLIMLSGASVSSVVWEKAHKFIDH